MASEAQRIMNVSLTKIMSSRSRRGGVSLHRNLLVASVLFKARDVYAAEMAGLVVIRNGCVYEPSALNNNNNNCDDLDTKAETQDLSNENLAADETSEITAADENFSTDENLIRDEQIMETLNAVVCPPSSVPDSTQEQSVKLDLAGDTSSHNKSNSELESCKENIEPANSNQSTADIVVGKVVKPKRSRKQASTTKQSLKRKYTEVEQAVLSITESEAPKKLSRVTEESDGVKMDLTCNELSSSFPEWQSDRICANHREENHVVNNPSATTSQDYKSSCMDISEDAYSSSCASDDDDQSTYSELTTYHQSSFHSFTTDYCTSSSSSDAITFSLSHPMLVSV